MFRYITDGGYKAPLVTEEYQEQLDNLAETLVRKTGEVAVQGELEFEQSLEDFDRVFGEA